MWFRQTKKKGRSHVRTASQIAQRLPGLFAVAQLHGYSVFLTPEDRRRPHAGTARPARRRLRRVSVAGGRRQVPAPDRPAPERNHDGH